MIKARNVYHNHKIHSTIACIVALLSIMPTLIAAAEPHASWEPEVTAFSEISENQEDQNIEQLASQLQQQAAEIAALASNQKETLENLTEKIYHKYVDLRYRNRQVDERMEELGLLVKDLITFIQRNVYPTIDTLMPDQRDEIIETIESFNKQIAEKILEGYRTTNSVP